jgi:hypothetical protein
VLSTHTFSEGMRVGYVFGNRGRSTSLENLRRLHFFSPNFLLTCAGCVKYLRCNRVGKLLLYILWQPQPSEGCPS